MNTLKTIELGYFVNPFVIFEKIANRNCPILLDSHHQITKYRFDIMVCDPIEMIQSTSFSSLKKYFDKKFLIDDDIPFAGGAVGFWSYESEMTVGIYDFAIISDHEKKRTFIASFNTQSNTNDLILEIKNIILN